MGWESLYGKYMYDSLEILFCFRRSRYIQNEASEKGQTVSFQKNRIQPNGKERAGNNYTILKITFNLTSKNKNRNLMLFQQIDTLYTYCKYSFSKATVY